MQGSLKKYGLVIVVVAAVAISLAVVYNLPKPPPPPKQLSVTADNFFKIRIGEESPFYGAARGGVPPYEFTWDFGDGSEARMQDATHTYKDEGAHHVTLTVKDSAGTARQVSHNVDVYPANANFTRPDDILRR